MSVVMFYSERNEEYIADRKYNRSSF